MSTFHVLAFPAQIPHSSREAQGDVGFPSGPKLIFTSWITPFTTLSHSPNHTLTSHAHYTLPYSVKELHYAFSLLFTFHWLHHHRKIYWDFRMSACGMWDLQLLEQLTASQGRLQQLVIFTHTLCWQIFFPGHTYLFFGTNMSEILKLQSSVYRILPNDFVATHMNLWTQQPFKENSIQALFRLCPTR